MLHVDYSDFELGQIVMTAGIAERCKDDPTFDFYVGRALAMHATCNWGDVCDEDWESNKRALKEGDRLFSAYWMDDVYDEKIWIITEADRSVTTILFPYEY